MTKKPAKLSPPVAKPPVGRVLSLTPTNPDDIGSGFDLTIQITTNALGKVTVTVHSAAATPTAAYTDAQTKLYKFGAEVAKLFDTPGSLH